MKKYKRLLAMGDVHGQYALMCEVLEKAQYNPQEDKLVLLGDYIDRGPDSRLVIERVRTLVEGGATALLGNHEVAMIKAMGNKTDYEAWSKNNGGEATIKSFAYDMREMRRAVRFLRKLPRYYEFSRFVFAHGAVNTELRDGRQTPLNEQQFGWLIWNRHIDNPKVRYNGKVVVVGHTLVQAISGDENNCEPIVEKHAIYLDTGAVLAGQSPAALTIMNLFTREYWQAVRN